MFEIPKQFKAGPTVKKTIKDAKESASASMGSSFIGNIVLA